MAKAEIPNVFSVKEYQNLETSSRCACSVPSVIINFMIDLSYVCYQKLFHQSVEHLINYIWKKEV